MYTSSLHTLPDMPIMQDMLVTSSAVPMSFNCCSISFDICATSSRYVVASCGRSPVEDLQLRCRYHCLDGVLFLLSIVVTPITPPEPVIILFHLFCIYDAGPYNM